MSIRGQVSGFPAHVVLAVSLIAAAWHVSAEEFNWSWEAGVEETATAPATPAPASTNAPAGGFKWTFDPAGKPVEAAAVPAAPPAAPAARAPASGVDAAAYQQLIKENLELRKQVEQALSAKESAESANRRLQKEMADLDSKIAESAVTIQSLRAAQSAAAGDEGRLAELKAQAAAAESQKEQMGREMAVLQARLAELQAAEAPPPPPESGVKPGSDLFRRIEEENAAMRARLAEMDRQRAEEQKAREQAELAAASASEKAQAAGTQLVAAQQRIEEAAVREKQDKKKVEDVLSRIPELEQKLSQAETVSGRHESIADRRDSEMASLREELARREYRLRKAEKMAAMLQEARKDVQEVSDREKRDMHYNMAAVYARDGRYREAEREYLMALDLDPADAACHFNLGILYDDRLKDKRRAAIHYRRYLKLAPHASDADQVKTWLMKIDME